jgi:hypothetical protein
MSFGFAVALVISDISSKQNTFSYWSSFFFWATIVGIPVIVRYFSKTTFVKDNMFLNSEGDLIAEESVPDLGLIMISMIASVIITGLLFDKFKVPDHLGTVVISAILFGIPSLYFMFKNCPISILFNHKYWESRPIAKRNSSGNDDHYQQYISGCRNRINSPIYQNLPGNVHYRHR